MQVPSRAEFLALNSYKIFSGLYQSNCPYMVEQYQDRDDLKEAHPAGLSTGTWYKDMKHLGTDLGFMFPGSSGMRGNIYFHTALFFWPKKPFRYISRHVFFPAPNSSSHCRECSSQLLLSKKGLPASVRVPVHSGKALPYFQFCLQAVTSLENTKPTASAKGGILLLWFMALSFLDFSQALKALRLPHLPCSEDPRVREEMPPSRPSFHHAVSTRVLLTFEYFLLEQHTLSVLYEAKASMFFLFAVLCIHPPSGLIRR